MGDLINEILKRFDENKSRFCPRNCLIIFAKA